MARKSKTLHDLHAEAGSLAAQALNVFHAVAEDLHRAALSHHEVADQAQEVADQHLALVASAREAADQATRQAQAVSNLVK